MSASKGRWQLLSVSVQDILAYQGPHHFDFAEGLQVIEAANHSGKTSLTTALLWGLTGQIPGLSRINRQSYRLTNKHAGDNADPRVTIRLADSAGLEMEIRRRYHSGRKKLDDEIELTLGEEEWSGDDAEARILAELGIEAQSLEGCGVVLQDHRLKLITGTDSEISAVVNDMLGLEALSEVVPVIEEQKKEAAALNREIQGFLGAASPLRRWKEEEDRLVEELEVCENRAVETGFSSEEIETPAALMAEALASVAEALGTDVPAFADEPAAAIEHCRTELGRLRRESAWQGDLSRVMKQQTQIERLRERWHELAEALEALMARHQEMEEAGAVDEGAAIKQLERSQRSLEELAAERRRIEGERGVLEAAYTQLQGAGAGADTCPVCQQAIEAAALLEELRERVDARSVEALEQLDLRRGQAEAARDRAESRLEEIRSTRSSVRELVARLQELGIEAQAASVAIDELPPDADARADDAAFEALRRTLAEGDRALSARSKVLGEEEQKLQATAEAQESETFQPLEQRLNQLRDSLLPLLEAEARLEAHGALREPAARQDEELASLAEEAKQLASLLTRLVKAVSEEEHSRASAAIRRQAPFISEFFGRVCGNPDFTGLDIDTNVSRGKVAYRLRAISDRMASLNDAVGHVLSEGDLSVAGMSLLIALARGASHRLGFLLLDDPAQGMDPTIQRRFAEALLDQADLPQMVILTHQPDFAIALADQGAEHRKLGRWESGRLHDD